MPGSPLFPLQSGSPTYVFIGCMPATSSPFTDGFNVGGVDQAYNYFGPSSSVAPAIGSGRTTKWILQLGGGTIGVPTF